MIDDDVLNRAYNTLSFTPQRTSDMANQLRMDPHKLSFILAILKRQGKAVRLDLSVELAHGYRSTRSFWAKTQ